MSSLASSLMTRIVSNAKFAVEIFDGSGHFLMWQGEVLDVLFKQGIDIAIEEQKPDGVGEEDYQWCCLRYHSILPRKRTKVSIHKGTSANKLSNSLEEKFLKKNNQNKLYMKEACYASLIFLVAQRMIISPALINWRQICGRWTRLLRMEI